MEYSYAAFISYRHAPRDSAVAKALHTAIEQYHIPKELRRGGKKRFDRVFRDEEELAASPDLSQELRDALDRSEHLIVVCSPETAQSCWVGQEIAHFLAHHSREKVITVLAAGEPGDVVPEPLRQKRDPADGSVTQADPRSADVRADSPGKMRRKLRTERLRVFAAMLGCPYDALAQREQRRKMRRILGAGSAVLAAALSFSAVLMGKNAQIRQANEELAAQKEQVQLRESELLTQNAREALEAGDYAAAIESAVSALDGAGTDRPYYAPAEQALLSALDVCKTRESSAILLTTELEQMTEISNFCISPDGSRIVTIDPFGTLNGFDTVTGEILWTQASAGAGKATVYDTQWPLLVNGDGTGFVCLCGGSLEARRFEDGQLLWQHEKSVSPFEERLIQSPDGARLAWLETEFVSISSNTVDLYLNVVSTAEGETICRICLLEDVSYWDLTAQTMWQEGAGTGVFSADGTQFAGCWMQVVDGQDTLVYYLADLTAGTLRILRREILTGAAWEETVTDMSFCADGSALLVTRLSPEGALKGGLEKIDLQSGELVWGSVPAPEDWEETRFYDEPLKVIHQGDTSYLYRGDLLCAVNNQTGGWECIKEFPGELTALEFTQEHILGCVDKTGRYTLVWQEESGFYTSGSFGTVAELGAVKQAGFWGGGFLRAELEDGVITGLSMAEESEDRGFVALIPEGDDQKIQIRRSRSLAQVQQMQLAEVGDQNADSLEFYGSGWGDTLVLGPFVDIDLSDSDSSTYRFMAVDAETLESQAEFHVDWDMDMSNYHFLPDGVGYVFCDADGNIRRYDGASGEGTVLSQEETVTVLLTEEVDYQASACLSTSVRRLSDQVLLTARCGEELTLWINGAEETAVALPEGLTWQMTYRNIYKNRCLVAGGNGYVVVSSFADESDGLMDGFAAYDTVRGTWIQFPDAGDGERGRVYALGETPVFAAADLDGTVHLYDLTDGTVMAEFPLQLPTGSVIQMCFCREDTLMVVKTADQQIVIYDTASGGILYREVRETTGSGSFQVWWDGEKERLYIADSRLDDASGLCLDTRSWTKLCNLSGLIWFDGESGACYSYSGSPTQYLIRQRIPSTGELVEMGKAILGLA